MRSVRRRVILFIRLSKWMGTVRARMSGPGVRATGIFRLAGGPFSLRPFPGRPGKRNEVTMASHARAARCGAPSVGKTMRPRRTKLSVRAYIRRCRWSCIFLFSFCSSELHLSLHFLPVLTGRKRSKGRNSRPRFRPKIFPRRLPPRNSLPAVAQTSAPASRRPVKILPCGPASNGMGGELHQC